MVKRDAGASCRLVFLLHNTSRLAVRTRVRYALFGSEGLVLHRGDAFLAKLEPGAWGRTDTVAGGLPCDSIRKLEIKRFERTSFSGRYEIPMPLLQRVFRWRVVPRTGLEPAPANMPTRPSTLRVYQFHHLG